MYVAFGLSAYYSTMVVDPYLTYSESLNLPFSFFNTGSVRIMRQGLNVVEHTLCYFYKFRTRIPIGEGATTNGGMK